MATTKKAAARQPEQPAEPKPGVVLRGYRLSLRAVEETSVFVGGNALGGLRLVGLPKGATEKMQRGQKRTMHGVTHYSDVAGTKVAHGVGAGKRLAVQGSKKGAKAWVRGMKFFMTLQ